MKRTFYWMMAAVALMCGCSDEAKETERPGGIYGVITDKATSEPIRAAGVQLNTGEKTTTGNDGQYEFTELKAGDYTLQVTKTGYTELFGYKIKVEQGKTIKGDIQIEKLPESLRVVNDRKENIDTLAFGSETSLVERSFSIFNDGPESLEWVIMNNCNWISKLSASSGTLQAGKQQPVVLTIDREKLGGGENTYILNISSSNGNKELTITAIGNEKSLAMLNTLGVSNIAATTATFNGEITATGSPAYTERGFVYSTSSMPTVDKTIAKLTVMVTANASYSTHVSGLTLNQKYYVRAYAVNTVGVAYSTNEESFTTAAIMPTLTTQAVTNINIAAGTATFNGTIGSIGDPAYTERGFVYGTSNNPTIADTKKVAPGTGSGAYSLEVTEIPEGKTYYVRAYATNDGGTVYGDEVNFATVAGMPEISTEAVTNVNIAAGTATFNGTIISVGDLSYTERGFVYGKTHNPTISDTKKIASGTGIGKYSLNVSEIAEGYTYYVRAYVTNSKGTVYGEEVSFVFTATMPTLSTQAVSNMNVGAGTATFNGTVITVGDPAYTERGFVYGITRNPTIHDGTKRTAAGTGTGIFSLNITGLSADQTYYVRAYATNSKGSVYGDEVSFILDAALPSVSTQAVSNKNIGAGTATFNGTIISLGSPAYTERGFVYGTTRNPSIDDATKKTVSGTGTGVFSLNTTELTTDQTYYVRAYASNTKGTVYGEEVSFILEAVLPSVSTQTVSNKNIGAGTATFNGTVTSLGSPAYTERGFVYGTSQNPTIGDTKETISGTVTGAYTFNATGLKEGTVYHIRAYATNAKGTAYGENVSVDFTAVMPTLSTQAVTNRNINAGTATFNGTIVSVGDLPITERGFVYGTSQNPTIDDTKKPVSGTGTGAYTFNATGLQKGIVYHIRAYATNAKGTTYGENVSVDFTAVMPTLSTQAVTNRNINAGTATFNGTIVSAGDLPITERGFVYGTSQNPTIDDTKKPVSGTGTGAYTFNATGLKEGEIYYIRAYASNSEETVYGEQVSLDFNATMPTITTQAVSDKKISAGTATFHGTIVSAGDLPITERGFVYGTSQNPTIDDTKKLVSGTGTGAYTFNATGLQIGTIYHVRAYVTNAKGTRYGENVSVDFTAIMPALSTQAVTNRNVVTGSATLNGTITTVGDPAYTERGFVYGTMHNPTVEDDTKKQVTGSGTGIFSTNITGLKEGEIYYIRAYATNIIDTKYGNEVDADFHVIMPTVTTQAVTNIDETTATFNGNIVSVGDYPIIERGFVHNTMHNPTVESNTKSTVSGSTGQFFSNITGLTNGVTYYVRAFATTAKGTVYGTEISFVPTEPKYVVISAAGIMVQKTDIGSGYWSVMYSLCDNSVLSGYTDWRMPSKDELAVLYNERNTIGGFSSSPYWSSSTDGSYHWYQRFDNGLQGSAVNSYSSCCRCVRTLP